jgi:hypothetical protein
MNMRKEKIKGKRIILKGFTPNDFNAIISESLLNLPKDEITLTRTAIGIVIEIIKGSAYNIN